MLDAPLERGLGGETFIPSSGSRRRLVFLNWTQTLTKLKETTNKEALPPPFQDPPCPNGPRATGDVTDLWRRPREAQTLDLLCTNVSLQHFVFQRYATYH